MESSGAIEQDPRETSELLSPNNGEVRLWGERRRGVGGQRGGAPDGLPVQESEGSPVEFKNIRIRELP